MKILFAGGGTAGHINPALAVAGYIKEKHPDAEISYIGTADKLEAKLVPEKGYDFHTINVAGFQRKLSLKNIARNINAVGKAVSSSLDSKKILKEINPDIVVGTGGYVSGPVLKPQYTSKTHSPALPQKCLQTGWTGLCLPCPKQKNT